MILSSERLIKKVLPTKELEGEIIHTSGNIIPWSELWMPLWTKGRRKIQRAPRFDSNSQVLKCLASSIEFTPFNNHVNVKKRSVKVCSLNEARLLSVHQKAKERGRVFCQSRTRTVIGNGFSITNNSRHPTCAKQSW